MVNLPRAIRREDQNRLEILQYNKTDREETRMKEH